MNNDTMILFTRFGMGDAPGDLQKKLASIFLTMLNQDRAPGIIAFYGEGVKLVCADSPVIEPLRALESKGARLIVCQTCLDFFDLRAHVCVGIIGGMGDIIAAMNGAAKVLSV
jgi:hypothetical protein